MTNNKKKELRVMLSPEASRAVRIAAVERDVRPSHIVEELLRAGLFHTQNHDNNPNEVIAR